MLVRRATARFGAKRALHAGAEPCDALGMDTVAFAALLPPTEPRYRASQVSHFVHRGRGERWADALTLPPDLREWLDERVAIDPGRVLSSRQSSDGTRRYLVAASLGRAAECVLIPDEKRTTLCVSSQVGCTLACTFCRTGTQRHGGNLSAGDIVRQLRALPAALHSSVTHVVFMGQGEPLYNLPAVSRAIAVLSASHGIARARMTVSTAGVAPHIPRVASELGTRLAVSLHAPTDELRTALMAVNRRWPLADVLAGCAQYLVHASATEHLRPRVTFEYVMLRGVNDSAACARDLAALLRPLGHARTHVNMIPFNGDWPGAPYEPSAPSAVDAFRAAFRDAAPAADITLRRTRGADVLAACGQLSASVRDLSSTVRDPSATVSNLCASADVESLVSE